MTAKDANLIGRGAELSRLREMVAPPFEESRVQLILGDPGMGKTVLLAEAARQAKSAGMRVLAAAGRESEQDLAFAGLYQLLRPVLDRVAGLPARQAAALGYSRSKVATNWRRPRSASSGSVASSSAAQ